MSLVAAAKKTVTSALLSVFLMAGVLVPLAFPAAVHAQPAPAPAPAPAPGGSASQTGLCFDGLGGVVTKCSTTPSERYPIDGKRPANFDQSKCYRILDPEKGWETFNCSDQIFKDVVDTTRVGDVEDNAKKGNCPEELDPAKECDIVALYLNPIINGLAVAVVLFVVIAIIIGGIQYSASADQPQAAAAAKGRIINAIIALVCFMFLWAFLQWVVPGGML